MNYTDLLKKSFEIVRSHLYLILLGALVALSGGYGSSSNINFSFGSDGFFGGSDSFNGEFNGNMPDGMMPPEFGPGMMQNWEQLNPFGALPILAIIFIAGIAIAFGLALWAISTVARGGLVVAVEEIEAGDRPGFARSIQHGLRRVWTLLGIGLIPGIPGLILFVVGAGTAISVFGMMSMMGDGGIPLSSGLAIGFVLLACIMIPLVAILRLLQTFAERAAMLEQTGIIASYRRGIQVLSENLKEAVGLFLIQVVITIGFGLVMAIPGLLLSLCFLFWPLLLVINGAVAAYFSTVWTLAWQEWTASPLPSSS